MAPSEFVRMLDADEAAKLGLPPTPDVETPTTDLVDSRSQATAEAHAPGNAPSAKAAAGTDSLPDPTSLTKER